MTMMLRLVLLLVLAATVFESSVVQACISFNAMPMVKTEHRNIYGKYQPVGSKQVAAFLGVPYAKPPLGSLRFERPVPIEVQEDPIYALRNGPACMQYPFPPAVWADLKPGKSEDCLYLNIWVPESKPSESLLPVMFWIHGGVFIVGSNRLDTYDGRALAAFGDVIVVTINYRLGLFGFLYSNTLDAPGNAGLFDILEALKWVHNNIRYFGGDKNEITIFGQSAGSMMTGSLGISHLARPLFKRMIMQSGAPTGIMLLDGPASNFNRTIALAELLGCIEEDSFGVIESGDMVNCLKGMNAERLLLADASLNTPVIPPYKYQYDDELLEINPLDSVMAGDIKDCELLIGVTKDEGSDLLTAISFDYFGLFGEKNSKLSKPEGYKMIDETFPYIKDNEAIVNYYYADVKDDDYENIAKQTYKILGDLMILCPSVYFAEKMAEKNSVFYYTFEHRPSVTPYAEWMGVGHLEEIQFVFGQPLREPERYLMSEQTLSREMVKIWTNFAKTGKTDSAFGNWPLYSRQSPRYKILNSTIINAEELGPEKERCNFLRTTYNIP